MTNGKKLPKPVIDWWASHRPIGWTTADHLENPDVNCTYSDVRLARWIASQVKKEQETKKQTKK